LRSFSLLIGQAVWAACQAGVIFFLTGRPAGISLVGSLTFALAIFSPLCLLGSLNTRNLVAIGRGRTLSLLRDIYIRATVVLVAILVVVLVLLLTEKFRQFALLTFLLLILRGADQLSDVSAGYYQQHNKTKRLVFSYCGRGLISLAAVAIAYGFFNSLQIAVAVSAIATLLFVIWFDIAVPWKSLPREVKGERKEDAKDKKVSSAVKLFPFFDSLHANSLRLAMGAIFPTEIVGILGIVQTAFAPVQIFISAIALSNLRRLAILSDSSNANFKNLLNRLVLISFVIVLFFGLLWMLVDANLVGRIFPSLNPSEIKEVGVFFSLSMLLFGPTGFYAQAALIKRRDKIYGLAPLIGLGVFCIFIAASKTGVLSVGLFGLCLCFMLSNALKAVMCYLAVFRGSN
jgi:O-antigen/teichoic acid export membrane protein